MEELRVDPVYIDRVSGKNTEHPEVKRVTPLTWKNS